MKIKTIIDPTDTGAHIYVTTDGRDPDWLYLRWREEDNGLWGCFARPGNTGLAVGKPVRLEGVEGVEAGTVGTLALGAFIVTSGMRVVREGDEIVDERASQLDAWESFLSSGTTKAASKKTIDAIEISEAQMAILQQAKFLSPQRAGGGGLLVRRDHPVRSGRHMSGFEMQILQSAISKKFEAIKSPPEIDIAHAKKALEGAPRPSSTAVSWFGEKGEHTEDRMQAAQVYPILAGMIADIPALRKAVDAREPIQQKLIDATGLSKGAFKRLSKVRRAPAAESLFEANEAVAGEDAIGVNRIRRHRIDGGASLNTILRHLADLPPDRCPQDDESWEIFQNVLTKIAIPLENAIGLPVARTLAGCKGDWKQFHALLAKSADFDPKDFTPRTMALTTIDAIEAIEDMAAYAVTPLMLNAIQAEEQEMPTIEREYFLEALAISAQAAIGKSKNPATNLLEMARRYASRIPALIETAGGEAERRSQEDARSEMQRRMEERKSDYLPLAEPFTASNGLVVVNLRSDDEMREESSRLSHCVGHYYLRPALRSDCHIFSIQTPDRESSHATFEVGGISEREVDQTGNYLTRPRIVQFRARRNAEPGADARLAFEEWKAACAAKNIALATPLTEFAAWRAEVDEFDRLSMQGSGHAAAPRQVTWKSILGYDWSDAERGARMWRECAYVMGGDWGRSDNPGVIWRDGQARNLLGKMSPQTAAILEQRAREAKAEKTADNTQEMSM